MLQFQHYFCIFGICNIKKILMNTANLANTDANTVLCKALFSTKERFKLTQAELGKIIGMERTSITRLKERGKLDPSSKTGELATLLIRVYRSLYTLMGGEDDNMRHWLNTYNLHLNDVPKHMVLRAQGLVDVNNYLDAIRGKN